MKKTTLNELLEEGKSAYFIMLNPEEALIKNKDRKEVVLFPYDFSRLNVYSSEKDKEISALEKEAEKLGLKDRRVYSTLIFMEHVF